MGDAVGEDSGLARPGPGHDQHRPLRGCHRFPLAGIEFGQQRRIDQQIVFEPHRKMVPPYPDGNNKLVVIDGVVSGEWWVEPLRLEA